MPAILCMVLIFALALLISISESSAATPEGPTITLIRNQTSVARNGSIANISGAYIGSIRLNATQQNTKWKAYVGNVTGKMTLDDAAGQTIYDWPVSNPSGIVHATRKSTAVSWSNIQCANLTHIENENRAINQTSDSDNITSTFPTKVHAPLSVGLTSFGINSCYSTHAYVNSTAQSTTFDEVALYDGTDASNGNIVYATRIENSAWGFNNQSYSFQMLIPEIGLPTWASSTAYYFYVELQ